MSSKLLKEAIFEITKNERDSDSRNQDKALKVFINFSLAMALKNYTQKAELKGTDMSSRLLITQNVIQEDLCKLSYDVSSLIKPYLIYLEMVGQSEPFTDVLSSLYEQILLEGKGGDGLGQFLTPLDLSKCLSSLMFNSESVGAINVPTTLTEPTCGAGSLILAPLNRVWSIDPSKLKFMNLMINDIDGLAVRAATLQLVSNLLVHPVELGQITVFCANLITEYMKEGKHFISLVPAPLSFETNVFEKLENFISQSFFEERQEKKEVSI